MKEYNLFWILNKDNTFGVFSGIRNPLEYSVFIIHDYPYTPWPREGGNLLWS